MGAGPGASILSALSPLCPRCFSVTALLLSDRAPASRASLAGELAPFPPEFSFTAPPFPSRCSALPRTAEQAEVCQPWLPPPMPHPPAETLLLQSSQSSGSCSGGWPPRSQNWSLLQTLRDADERQDSHLYKQTQDMLLGTLSSATNPGFA